MSEAPASIVLKSDHGDRRRGAWFVVMLALAMQFALQAHFFPWAALGNEKRLLYIDSAFHQFQMEVARQLCAEKQVVGYDPLFAAGQGAGVARNASAKLQALLACAAGSADDVARVYKQVSFWQGVLAPALIAAAAAMLGLGTATTALVALFATLAWWTGGARWYHTAGMVSYVIAAYLTLPFVVAVRQVAVRPWAWGVLGVSLFAAVGMWIHPLFPLAAALAGVVWFLSTTRGLAAYARLGWVVVVMLLAMLAVNHTWIAESARMVGGSAYPQPYQREVSPLLPLLEAIGRASTAGGGLRLGVALFVGSVLCVLYVHGRHRSALLGLVAGGLVLMAWASFGGLLESVASLQPNRFTVLAWLCLMLPAAAGFVAALGNLKSLRGLQRLGTGMAVLLVIGVTLFSAKEAHSEIFSAAGAPRYAVAPPEVKGEGPLSKDIVRFLMDKTNPEARVLFETSMARVHDGAHMAGFYGLASGREFIGGAYPHMDFASAWDGFALGGLHQGRTTEALTRLLDAYNVKWMMCHSVSCKAAMRAQPDAIEVASFGPVVAFERRAAPGYVVQGTGGVVERCVNRVQIEGASGSPLVLRYHWVPGLRSEPSGRVEPVDLVPGARPFVAIHDPPANLVLRIGDGAGRPCRDRAHSWR